MDSKEQELVVIPRHEWSTLRDLYLQNWPQHIFIYHTLANYVQWAEKDPKMCEREFKMHTIDAQWREHGTYILEDNNGLCNTILLSTTATQYNEALLKMLRSLELDAFCTLLYCENTRAAAEQFLLELGITDFTKGYCPTILYRLPKEECLKLELNTITGYTIKPLSLQHAKVVNDNWTHRYPGSEHCVERVIRYNMTFGAFDHENLASWVVLSEYGNIALLHVKECYRRQGLAEYLVRYMCRELGKQGMDALTTVMETNTASTRLFKKLGFQPIDRVYWFDIVGMNKKSTQANEKSKM